MENDTWESPQTQFQPFSGDQLYKRTGQCIEMYKMVVIMITDQAKLIPKHFNILLYQILILFCMSKPWEDTLQQWYSISGHIEFTMYSFSEGGR